MSAVCPLCGTGDGVPAFAKSGYHYFDCPCCEALYVSPRPSAEEIAELYRRCNQDIMSRLCWSDTPASHRHFWSTWEEILDLAQTLAGQGPLLDLACGTGQFLAWARERGWSDLTGVEVVPEAAQAARRLTGAKILVSDLTVTGLPSHSFAVVVLWDIVEHLGDVRKALVEARRLLRPGGVVVIGTVNRHGLSLRLRKERALTVMPPEHLTFLTRSGVSRALHAAGLTPIRSWSCSIFLKEWARFLPQVRQAPADPDEGYPQWRARMTGSRALLAAIKVANRLLRVTDLGDELVAIAQKSLAS